MCCISLTHKVCFQVISSKEDWITKWTCSPMFLLRWLNLYWALNETETVIHLTHLLPFNRHHCLWFCHRNGMEGTSLVMSTSALGTYLLLAHTSHLKSSNWVKSIPIPPSQLTWCLDVIKLYFPLLFWYRKWIKAVQILANVSAPPPPHQENFLRPLKKFICQTACVPTLTLSLPGCGNSGKWLNFSELQFQSLWKRAH